MRGRTAEGDQLLALRDDTGDMIGRIRLSGVIACSIIGRIRGCLMAIVRKGAAVVLRRPATMVGRPLLVGVHASG